MVTVLTQYLRPSLRDSHDNLQARTHGRQAVTKEQVLAKLTANGFVEDGEKPIQNGVQVRFSNGSIVNVFDSGSVTPGGKQQDLVKAILGLEPGRTKTSIAATVALSSTQFEVSKKVFVVYGHDQDSRARLDAMLRRWGLEPLILDQLPSEGQTIIEKLEKYAGEAGFGVVLATPDDEGYRRNHPDEKAFRARQNVVLELGHASGYAWTAEGRDPTPPTGSNGAPFRYPRSPIHCLQGQSRK